ncbi:hypothetical protein AMAG_20608 [Allomyces macrogynus ATCC 38327]|uniref:Uncharacterized protein n=1 Tax=Allomyces macrogynus (strain ATCC 38327) TaxID=578462 RepID=A0A0L0TD24_ALLM3|nr:hypothetical protein AMAG_20608 [Allomyces macrogynus ATCC 38327]|eukprot:KNE72575.1 hypothetical protein AMAG_20608 [Allomyces macrogynus ATCC 38327]
MSNNSAPSSLAPTATVSFPSSATTHSDEFMILFGLRASSTHDAGAPYPISVCEPIVVTNDGQHGRSLVDTLVEAHGTLPAPARALIKNILNVNAQLAEIVRMSGGMAVAVSSDAQWHLDLPSNGQLLLYLHRRR